jgi:hypothetical protein
MMDRRSFVAALIAVPTAAAFAAAISKAQALGLTDASPAPDEAQPRPIENEAETAKQPALEQSDLDISGQRRWRRRYYRRRYWRRRYWRPRYWRRRYYWRPRRRRIYYY